MKKILFPYGKEEIEYLFDENELVGVLESSINTYEAKASEGELVLEAMKNPTGTKHLCELARGKNNVVIIASDHTRPVPSKFIIPPMLKEIRKGSPNAKITILIATGCHRGTTKDELRSKFGDEIVEKEEPHQQSSQNYRRSRHPTFLHSIISSLIHCIILFCQNGTL